MQKHLLKLYVTGKTPRARRAIANLRKICTEAMDGNCEVIVIDVLEHPDLAEADRILVTPTLIKQLPPPVRRVLGDLSDVRRVMAELQVDPEVPAHAEAEKEEG